MKTIWLQEQGWGASLRAWWDRYQRHGDSVIHHLTIPRLGNAMYLMLEMAMRRTKIHAKPVVFKIEPTNFCNFQCPGCRTGTGEDTGPKGMVDFENFKKMVDRMAPYAFKLILYMWGEPFINKNIFKMIEYASQKNVAVQISTNMNVFRPEIDAVKLVDSGLEHMIVALDGVTQEVYQIYRIGGQVNKVIQNVEAILAERRKRKKRYPFVELQFIVFPHNRQELPKVREVALRLGVDRLTLIESKTREEAMIQDGKQVQPDRCSALWLMACFNWNGSFSPCCDSVDDSFGNILEEDFDSLWNSQKIIKSRSLHTNKPVTNGIETKCTRCRIYRGYVTFLPEKSKEPLVKITPPPKVNNLQGQIEN
ncbi:MAG TPA: radical SAM protein [Terriglobia bacterium]|nr:radical SAM protein [Terriglobia bacterium]